MIEVRRPAQLPKIKSKVENLHSSTFDNEKPKFNKFTFLTERVSLSQTPSIALVNTPDENKKQIELFYSSSQRSLLGSHIKQDSYLMKSSF